MDEKEISIRLHLNEVEEFALLQILLNHFHGARGAGIDSVVYPGDADENNFALKCIFKRGRLAKVTAGPLMSEDHLSAVQSVIEAELRPTPLRVSTEVLFSSVPVRGYFRYNDVFQILPVPEEAPKPGDAL